MELELLQNMSNSDVKIFANALTPVISSIKNADIDYLMEKDFMEIKDGLLKQNNNTEKLKAFESFFDFLVKRKYL